MDFLPTEDQEALRAGVREICTDTFPRERLGQLAETGAGFDPALWETLKELGVFGLLLPESDGGLGLGLGDAVLVYEELGRALVPGPLVGTLLAAGLLGLEIGAPVGIFDLSAEEPGRTLLIEHPDVITKLVVLDGDDARIIDASELSTTPVSILTDPLTPLGEIAALPAGTPLEGGAASWRTRGSVLTAALETGIAMAACELAVQYAKEREQFGRPIGAFQAVKHMCSDMHVRAQIASVAVHSAAVTLDYPEVGDAQRAIASAKILADDAATTNAKTSIQVHGGMGFTWEVVVHYYLKRGWVHQSQFGDADTNADALAALL
ncbi:MAG TPA: acyl-CoA dehydrogenase family protein [Frankiaceae bacterium]|jgi:alkylation response protein AidB-like acyl-CoA dehydrogenase|nr:acyl-CoA dehydrogenase family protein [Frankiaceae bacterium]